MATITYRISTPNRHEYLFQVDLDKQQTQTCPENMPDWIRLENNKCTNCPLDSKEILHCPAALSIHKIAAQFHHDFSITRVDVCVDTIDRSYVKNTDLQTCLRSLFGLVMATSGCPVLSRMRAMAVFHLPFSNLDETIFRIVSTYLVKQYLAMQHGEDNPDWELKGIEDYYHELGVVNQHLLKRLRQASRRDANINAIQQFISISGNFSITEGKKTRHCF